MSQRGASASGAAGKRPAPFETALEEMGVGSRGGLPAPEGCEVLHSVYVHEEPERHDDEVEAARGRNRGMAVVKGASEVEEGDGG